MTQPVPTLIGGSASLKPAQEIVLASLDERGTAELSRSEYEEISGVSRSQAAYDIAELVALGILERVGSGRATRYRLPGGGAGRPKKWTDDRIRAQLRELHFELGRWPRAADFRDLGRSDLYVAASRKGGIERWARELAPAEADVSTEPGTTDSRTWLSSALVLSAILVLLTVVGPNPKRPATAGEPSPRASAPAGLARAADADHDAVAAHKAVFVFTADQDADLAVRRRSATGRTVFSGRLVQGGSVRVVAPRIWVEVTSPTALSARLNGKTLRLPVRPAILVITPEGIDSVKRPPIEPTASAPVAAAPERTEAPAAAASVVPTTSTAEPASTSAPSADSQPSPDSPPPGPSPDGSRHSP